MLASSRRVGSAFCLAIKKKLWHCSRQPALINSRVFSYTAHTRLSVSVGYSSRDLLHRCQAACRTVFSERRGGENEGARHECWTGRVQHKHSHRAAIIYLNSASGKSVPLSRQVIRSGGVKGKQNVRPPPYQPSPLFLPLPGLTDLKKKKKNLSSTFFWPVASKVRVIFQSKAGESALSLSDFRHKENYM